MSPAFQILYNKKDKSGSITLDTDTRANAEEQLVGLLVSYLILYSIRACDIPIGTLIRPKASIFIAMFVVDNCCRLTPLVPILLLLEHRLIYHQ
jgi:hypothetical protein